MKTIKEFIKYCSITACDSSLQKIGYKMRIIDKFFKGNLNNLKLQDLHNFLAWLNRESGFATATKNDCIKIFKRFLKWKYTDWSKRFSELKDLKQDGNDFRKLDKLDLLTPDEMRILVNSTSDLKYKTILLILQETACRPEEILKVTWNEIDMSKGEIKLHSNKTGKTRFIPVKNSIEHLKRYREECFAEPPRATDKVFSITNQALNLFLKNLGKKTNFQKNLYPYLWRHSILTRMIRELSPKVYEMYSGHSLETGMKIYAHLDTEDLRKELNEKVYHLEKLTQQDSERLKKLELAFDEVKKFFNEIGSKNLLNIKEIGQLPFQK